MLIRRSIEIANELGSESLVLALSQEIAAEYSDSYERLISHILSETRSEPAMALFLKNIRPQTVSDSQWQLVRALLDSPNDGWCKAGREVSLLLADDSPSKGVTRSDLKRRLYDSLCPSWCFDEMLFEAREVADFLDRTRSYPSSEAFALIQLHEVISLAQFEFFTPLIERYLLENTSLKRDSRRKALEWCFSYLGDTERRHTKHAIRASEFWCNAEGVNINDFRELQVELAAQYFRLHLNQLSSIESNINFNLSNRIRGNS